jgi:hypothetical protein
LPDDVDALKALLRSQQAAHEAAHRLAIVQPLDEAIRPIGSLYEQLVLLRHRHFDASTEQSTGQARLFDEVEAIAADSTPEKDQVAIASQSDVGKKPRSRRRVASAHGCRPVCRAWMSPMRRPKINAYVRVVRPTVEIDEDISERLDIILETLCVLRPFTDAAYLRLPGFGAPSITRPSPRSKKDGAGERILEDEGKVVSWREAQRRYER